MDNRLTGCALAAILTLGSSAEQCCQILHPDPAALAAAVSRIEESVGPRMAAAMTKETQLDVVDVLVAYDTSAVSWMTATGKGSPEDFAAYCINKMNYALEQSQMRGEFHFRLAGTVTVPTNYSGLGFDVVLGDLITSEGTAVSTPAGRAIATKRNETGADIVSLLVSSGTTGMTGLGYALDPASEPSFATNPSKIPAFGNWAYNVCGIEAVAPDDDYTMLHEIGHNMGAGHPDADQISSGYLSPGPLLYPYSAGYYFWQGDEGFHTIMAYNFGGRGADGAEGLFHFTNLPYFSSPDLTFNGQPVGDAHHDNRRTLLETCHYVAQYRISKLPVESSPVDPAPVDPEPVDPAPVDPAPIDYDGVTGAFNPLKAVNGQTPYVGVLLDSTGATAGVVSLKVGKANANKGSTKVSGSIVTINGAKYTIKAAEVPTGLAPQKKTGIAVPKLGTLALTIGGSGFFGRLSAEGREYTMKTAATGGLSASPASFHLEGFEAPDIGGGMECLSVLPENEPVLSNGTKWVLRKAGSVKYKKTKEADGSVVFVLTGLDDPAKPNVSALKLSYAAKTSTFKGSFKVYYSNADSTPEGRAPKVKPLQISVTGVVSDGIGTGIAVSKKPVGGPWKVRVE